MNNAAYADKTDEQFLATAQAQDPMLSKRELGEIEVDWAIVPQLMDLKANFEEAKIHSKTHIQNINGWLDVLHTRGKHRPKKTIGRSAVQPKLARKQAEWRYSSLSEPFLSSTDLFKASPVTFDDKAAALQNQLVLNHQFTYQLDRGKFIDAYVRAAVDEGTVIVKVGWEYEGEDYTEEQPTFDLVPDPEFAETLQQVIALKEQNLNRYEEEIPYELKAAVDASLSENQPYRPEITGYEEVTKTRILTNKPTLEVCDSGNVHIDPTCNGEANKANFVIHTYEASHADLSKHGSFYNLDRLIGSGHNVQSEPEHSATTGSRNFEFKDQPRKRYVVNEYWGLLDIDGEGKLTPVVIAWIGDIYVRMELNPLPDQNHPFVAASYMPKKRSIYGEPDAELLEENQQIIGAVTRGMIDIMGRSANAQTGFQQGMLDAVNKAKWRKGDDYEFNGGLDPRTGIHMHTFNEIPNSAQFMLQQQNQEAESLTGVKAFYGGLNGDSLGDVATSVKGVLDSAARRELGILRRLSNGVIEIGRKVAAMNGVFLSEKEVIRLTNEQFIEVNKDELNGEFDLQLRISSAEEDNVKAQELGFMLQTMGNTIDISMTKLILADMFRLRKMPDLAKAIEEFEPEPDPFQQQMQELQLQEQQMKIALIEAQIAEINSEVQLDQAKTGTEYAKAEKLQAETDRAALDFVETESGVTQERDLQKAQAQAEGNMELERLKQGNIKELEQAKLVANAEQTLLQAYLDRRKEQAKTAAT